MNEQEILKLENKVNELTLWKEKRMRERLTYPLSRLERNTLDYYVNPVYRGFPIFTNTITGYNSFLILGLEVSINNQRRYIVWTPQPNVYTVDPLTDIFTNSAGAHGLTTNDRLVLFTDGILPQGIEQALIYAPINLTDTTFQLTTGTLPINVTDSGTGEQYYIKL